MVSGRLFLNAEYEVNLSRDMQIPYKSATFDEI